MISALSSRMTIKGQVTIPSEVRKMLRVAPGDVVVFEPSGDHATIRVRRSRLREIMGAAGRLPVPLSDEELEDAFERRVADEVMSRSTGLTDSDDSK